MMLSRSWEFLGIHCQTWGEMFSWECKCHYRFEHFAVEQSTVMDSSRIWYAFTGNQIVREEHSEQHGEEEVPELTVIRS
jgi:hypothetical protein